MTAFLAHHGLWAVFALMAIDAVFPAFSEVVMLYGGALATVSPHLDVFGSRTTGTGAYVAIALAGTIGYAIGALIGWAIGYFGGRPFLERHGRWFHLSHERLERAERWFRRWQDWAVFLGRLTPIARSFISIPAGVFEVPIVRYTVLSTIASAIWCFSLAGAGWGLGASWSGVHHGFRYVDYAVVLVVVLVAGYVIVRRRRSSTMTRRVTDSAR